MDLDIEIPTEKNRSLDSRINKLWHMVGNTPMLCVSYKYLGKHYHLYVKCEYFNLTGSIKDRMVLYILQKAAKSGQLREGDMIVEATSGNTGISLAAIGKALGCKVHIIMPDWLSEERINIIKSLGAEITLVSKENGGFLGSIRMAEEMAVINPAIFLPRQFDNEHNLLAHYKTTGRETYIQMCIQGYKTDAFVAGVGTGGTIMGVGKCLRVFNSQTLINAIEPKESPTLSTGYKVGSHRIQGISDEFIPSIVDKDEINQIIKVSDGDAILMAQKIASELGLGVGISSGANLIGAILTQISIGKEASVVTIFPDSNKKYFSTDLMKKEPVKDDYITPKVELLGYEPCSGYRTIKNT